MQQKKSPEEKVQCVLEKIKEQFDLGPKGPTTVMSGPYGYTHPAREVRFATTMLCARCGIDYVELEKILGRLQEDGLITHFKVVSEYA